MLLDHFPRQIKVGWKNYTINFDQDTHASLEGDSENGECLGITFPDLMLISMCTSSDYKVEILEETLLHEVLHTCINLAHLPVDEEQEEAIVGSLSNILFMVLRENPQLAKVICGVDNGRR